MSSGLKRETFFSSKNIEIVIKLAALSLSVVIISGIAYLIFKYGLAVLNNPK
jgi:hypothetical protein